MNWKKSQKKHFLFNKVQFKYELYYILNDILKYYYFFLWWDDGSVEDT